MDSWTALHALARHYGVLTAYHDGLGQRVEVGPDTLVRICAALGAEIDRPEGAEHALHVAAERAARP